MKNKKYLPWLMLAVVGAVVGYFWYQKQLNKAYGNGSQDERNAAAGFYF